MDQQLMTRILPPQNRRTFVTIFLFLFWTAAFAVAYTQWPLFSENQNTKFLHGLASAGVGALGGDWLANTIDPLPVFSLLVYLTARFLHQNVFYLMQALLLGVYLFSLLGIADTVFKLNSTRAGSVVFAVTVIAMHASLLWPFSMPALDTSVGWLLQAGVANQYLFNPVFQPASFGVLLILSIALFVRGYPFWAAGVAASSALFHSTYLPSAGLLTVAYMLVYWWEERSVLRTAEIGLLALVMVTPALLYNAIMLGPTTPEAWARAQAIIVNDRIPHHSLPEIWLDGTVGVKIGIVVLALLVVRRSRLFPVMLFCSLAAILLTLIQVSSGSDLIAFIAPWRMSVFLVPLSASMLIAWAVAGVFNRYESWVNRFQVPILIVAAIVLLFLVVEGVRAMQDSFTARRADGRVAMFEFVRSTVQPGVTFLTPTHMADFRLETGAPVVVTWKSHPYKDVEVIEWKERIDTVNGFYNAPSCQAADELASRYGVTHLLFEGGLPLAHCGFDSPVYQDDRFAIMALPAAP